MKKNIKVILVGLLLIMFSYIGMDLFKEYLYYNDDAYMVRRMDEVVEEKIKRIKETTDFNLRVVLAVELIDFVKSDNLISSYYSLDEVEKVLVEFAKKYDVELSNEVKKKSVLHYSTAVYQVGGHSRVIERWIENSPDDEVHSFAFSTTSIFPDRLVDAVKNKGGEIIDLSDKKNVVEKALELRRIASSYEKVVLHVFGNDYIPLIAFGTENFKRPVFLFNQIDHLFWVGVSIADCVVDYRKYGDEILKKYRGGKVNRIIPLPVDFELKHKYTREEAREMLNLPLDKKIVFSSGYGYKFMPQDGYNFGDFMEKFYQKRKDVLFVLVGPNADMLGIKGKIPQESYLFLESMPNDEYLKYLAAADIVIDSMPFSGGLTVVDAIIAKKPVLSLKTKFSQNDFIIESSAYKETMEELVESAVELYDDKEKAKDLWQAQFNALKERHGVEVWRKQIKELYDTFKTHSVHDFKSVKKEYEN